MTNQKASAPSLPREPIHRLTGPIAHFLHVEAASGIVLLIATAAALVLANSPLAHAYHELWHTMVSISAGSWKIEMPLVEWINDGLMVLFFFAIGMEVKYELVLGELRDPRQAILPMVAAAGGMIVPAAVYLAMQHGQPGERGWGIPMATDIAFVVGCMAILGRRVPHALRVMLLTLAIADDIGAILVIALGYSTGLSWLALVWAAGGLAGVRLLAYLGVRSFVPYTLLGILVWLAFVASGVHATLAGVILGLLTPARNYIGAEAFRSFLDYTGDLINGPEWDRDPHASRQAQILRRAARETISPLAFLQSLIHPWVSFVIMPIFALANAGVSLHSEDLASEVSMAAALGLLLGKPLGVLGSSWLAIRLGVTRLPPNVKGVPPFVRFGGEGNTPAVRPGGYLGPAFNPFTAQVAGGGKEVNPNSVQLRGVTLPSSFPLEELENRDKLLANFDRGFQAADRASDLAEGMDAVHQKALDLLRSEKTRQAFNLANEPQALLESYGLNGSGMALIVARRLVEAGARFVSVDIVGTGMVGGWDLHANNFNLLKTSQLPVLDAGLSTLLRDLDDRGMLDTTLVYCYGEMGRTPLINKDAGRDHWSRTQTVVLAGGGIRRGSVYGSTDEKCMDPATAASSPDDVAATIFHCLGFEPTYELTTPTNRPVQLFREGKVLHKILG